MTALLLTLFTAFSAHATTIPSGFSAQQCGPQTIDIARRDTHVMQAACIGFIAGTEQRAVQFTLSNDETFVFRIVGQQNMMMAFQSGATMSIFKLVGVDGEVIAMKGIVNRDGSLKSISGEFQKNSYIVPAFEQLVMPL